MDALVIVVRWVLAAVFLVAGAAKLADRDGSVRAMADFGVPEGLAGVAGVALPVVELAIAVGLVAPAVSWWAALGALAVLLGFIGAMGASLARGRRPDCHCFGQLHSEPVGPRSLVRNGVLAAAAVLVVARGPAEGHLSSTAWLGGMGGTEWALAAVAAVAFALLLAQWWFLVNVLRQNGQLVIRLERLESGAGARGMAGPPQAPPPPAGLPVGSPAPELALSSVDGATVTLDDLLGTSLPVVLVFTDPNCGPCTSLVPDIHDWQSEHSHQVTVAVVSRGSADDNRAKLGRRGLRRVLVQAEDEVADAYQVPGTPSAVLIRPDGTIASIVVAGPDAVRSLMAAVLGREGAEPVPVVPTRTGHGQNGAPAPGPKLGEPAPPLRLPDLEGNTVDLADFRGTRTMVLFWSTTCGFCQRMLPDLKEWEAYPPKGAPRLVVVSSGSIEDNRAMGLRSTVLVDENSETSQRWRAHGTPMAVVVDADGNIASTLAAGAPQVLALAGRSAKKKQLIDVVPSRN